MKIESKEVWVIEGRQFDSEEAAQAYESDRIGEFIEKCLLNGITFGPRDRLRLLANVLDHREALMAMLAPE
jgi:hypothetical protein